MAAPPLVLKRSLGLWRFFIIQTWPRLNNKKKKIRSFWCYAIMTSIKGAAAVLINSSCKKVCCCFDGGDQRAFDAKLAERQRSTLGLTAAANSLLARPLPPARGNNNDDESKLKPPPSSDDFYFRSNLTAAALLSKVLNARARQNH